MNHMRSSPASWPRYSEAELGNPAHRGRSRSSILSCSTYPQGDLVGGLKGVVCFRSQQIADFSVCSYDSGCKVVVLVMLGAKCEGPGADHGLSHALHPRKRSPHKAPERLGQHGS